ncbi:immunity protein Imm33 domain-containing protein [Lysobacter silvisoli]|uniref:DUF2185 domain-containing protein n=1 Tax=Lysobacter silvisoli TaxID=2293254 RepID=A0A371JYX8_9GAMM|nr:DUF2185 domain-containing protein [Lysobacter silvisoli]RDZ26866.1 DUF2185 domain-containing protein [Lysobacter silvisoli]
MWPFKKRQTAAQDKFAAFAPLVLASDEVMGPQRRPVRFAYRLAPNNEHDSGWVFLSGEESQDWLDAHPPKICPIRSFLQMDPSLAEVLAGPIGSAWERDTGDAPWRRTADFEPCP